MPTRNEVVFKRRAVLAAVHPVSRSPRAAEVMKRAAANHPGATRVTAEALAGAARANHTPGKVQITLRLDAAVVEAYKATGKGWQTRLNAVLAADVSSRSPDDIANALERAAHHALALATKLRIASLTA